MKKLLWAAAGGIALLLPLTIEAKVSERTWENIRESFQQDYNSPQAAKDPSLRIKAIAKLSEANHPEAVKILAQTIIPKELQSNDPLVVYEVIKTLGKLTDSDALNEAVAAAQKSPKPANFIFIAGLGLVAENPDVIKELINLAKSEDTLVQAVALRALTHHGLKEALPEVLKLLESENQETRTSAVRFLSKVTDETDKQQVLATLQKLSETWSGQPKNEVLWAMAKLTAQPPAFNNTVTFYDIPVASAKVLFLMDTTRSMDFIAKDGQKKRIDALKEELNKVLDGLPAETFFNLITFHEQSIPFQQQVATAREGRGPAKAWVRKMHSGGDPFAKEDMDLTEALFSTLGFPQKKPVVNDFLSAPGKNKPDTLFVVCDGRPDKGKYKTAEEILGALQVMNLTKQMRINVISIDMGISQEYQISKKIPMGKAGATVGGAVINDPGPDPLMMKPIADDHFGIYMDK